MKGDSQAPKRVGLDPQPMVDWLSPTELLRAGIQAVLATTFGNYADKREVQAALSPGSAKVAKDYSGAQELWFDYAADVGDGFNPTYALAWLMAQPALNVDARLSAPPARNGPDRPEQTKPPHVLPAVQFVVFGGDQVYPAAARDAYRKRFLDPFAVAFRTTHPSAAPTPVRDLFVLPGNHDWYDGLTSFTRLFCQGRGLGPLQTHQERSYFALRLPHDWWLWGIDIQLSADVDEPQKKFFQEMLKHMAQAAPGRAQRLILCTAEPSWVLCGDGERHADTLQPDPARHATLAYFERLASDGGVHVALTMSGDLHHYAHYTPDSAAKPHRVSSGGGGAFLYPTHHLPVRLRVPVGKVSDLWSGKREPESAFTYTLAGVYPPAEESRRLSSGVLKLPGRNITFACFLGALYLLFAWLVQSASKSINGAEPNNSLMEVLSGLGIDRLWDASVALMHVMRHSPSSASLASLVVLALWQYRAGERRSGQWWGAIHGALHVFLSMGLIWVFAWLNLSVFSVSLDSLTQVVLFTAEMLFAGGIAGGFLFAAYLLLSARLTGVHLNHVYSSQAIQDYKNFVRMRIRPDGELELYPIAIPHVPRNDGWRVTSNSGLDPATGKIRTALIEDGPVRISGRSGA